jgi:hypothetical protein
MKRPETTEYPAYYQKYIDLIKSDDILKVLDGQVIDFQELISEVSGEKENFVYAEGKWTPKQIIGHIIDTERIMAYRALRFARKDKTPLAGFDENNYVTNADFNKRTLYDLAHEFAVVRESNIALFKCFESDVLNEMGNANGKEMSVRSILFMIAGHAAHHINVIKTKYLTE